FGEGERYKHDDVLEVQVRVPLVVVPPGEAAAERRTGAASGVDVAPTLLGFAGIAPSPWMPGVDLTEAPPAEDRIVLVENRDRLREENIRHAVYRGPWKLVVRGERADGDAELFDLRTDPLGLTEVSGRHPDVVAELRRALLDLRESWGADEGRAPDWSDGQGLADHLRALGYGGH
ncbi:MAG: hypothetical protein VX460_03335, partial [Planctomycetota bacterium]|nr:hypothetical protein [Planctomycetota bacterium]